MPFCHLLDVIEQAIAPYRENDRPLVARHPAPTLGKHNIPVLRDILGLSQTEIDKLAAAGIIGTRAVPRNLRKARAAVG